MYNYGTINYNVSQPSPAQDGLQKQQKQQATQSFGTSQNEQENIIPSSHNDGSNNNNSSNNNNGNNSRYDRVKSKRNSNGSCIGFSESTKKLLVKWID